MAFAALASSSSSFELACGNGVPLIKIQVTPASTHARSASGMAQRDHAGRAVVFSCVTSLMPDGNVRISPMAAARREKLVSMTDLSTFTSRA